MNTRTIVLFFVIAIMLAACRSTPAGPAAATPAGDVAVPAEPSSSSPEDAAESGGLSAGMPVPGTEGIEEHIVEETAANALAPKDYTVAITDAGFVPATLTINKGDTVTWVNMQGRTSWPAGDVHPTHRSYPGSDIQHCFSKEPNTGFDACQGLQQNEEYSFVFEETGTWRYHDHLHSATTGSITVA